MKCIIGGINIKAFAKAIHSLSKIGDELYIESLSDGIVLRTVNSSRSAFMSFKFLSGFFQSYKYEKLETSNDSSDDEDMKCKISMPTCLVIFKSISSLEKSVEQCKIDIDYENSPKVVFTLSCKYGIVKTFSINFLESESLQAVFNPKNCCNNFTAHSRLLNDAFSIFNANQEEVSLSVSESQIILRTYIDDEPDSNKAYYSELQLKPEEFDNFQINTDTDITFCLKEIKALLSFTEVVPVPIMISFDSGGRPAIFNLECPHSLEAVVVVATLAEKRGSQTTSKVAKSVSQPMNIQNSLPKKPVRNPKKGPQKKFQESAPSVSGLSRTHSNPLRNSQYQASEEMFMENNDVPEYDSEESHLEEDTASCKRFKTFFMGGGEYNVLNKEDIILASDTDEECMD